MKPKVHYSILEDMNKYIKDFDPTKYEFTGDITDSSVITQVRNYYAEHLPIDVTAWLRVNKPDENLIYGAGLGKQVCFVRDILGELLFTYEEWEENPTMVIGTHKSKSVTLPVYQINLERHGIEIILRYNFYNWIISIKSDKPLEFDFMELFDPQDVIPSFLCEGFPEDKVYGCYAENHKQFTFVISSKYNLYTFMFLLKNYLKNSSD